MKRRAVGTLRTGQAPAGLFSQQVDMGHIKEGDGGQDGGRKKGRKEDSRKGRREERKRSALVRSWDVAGVRQLGEQDKEK